MRYSDDGVLSVSARSRYSAFLPSSPLGKMPTADAKDREGKPLLEGGGTKLLEGGARLKGPGGEAVLHDGKTDRLVYDAEDGGRPKLRISAIEWKDGGPMVTAL